MRVNKDQKNPNANIFHVLELLVKKQIIITLHLAVDSNKIQANQTVVQGN